MQGRHRGRRRCHGARMLEALVPASMRQDTKARPHAVALSRFGQDSDVRARCRRPNVSVQADRLSTRRTPRASEDRVAVTAARVQVLAFRLRRQHLVRRLGAASMVDVTATFSVRNSPPGSAQIALLALFNGVSEDGVSAALADRSLVEIIGPRMVPALVRPQDMAVFTVGGIGTNDESLRETLGKVAATALAEADI